MPQVGRGPQTLHIDIDGGTVDSNLVVRFEGLATLEDDKGTVRFPVSGTASPMEGNADCLIWDILGGTVWDGAVFESEGRLIAG